MLVKNSHAQAVEPAQLLCKSQILCKSYRSWQQSVSKEIEEMNNSNDLKFA